MPEDRQPIVTNRKSVTRHHAAPPRGPSTLVELIENFAAHGERPAIRTAGGGTVDQWTYAEVLKQSRRVAAGLRKRGVAEGDRVVLMSSSRPEWIVLCAGVLLAGAILVPLDSQLRGDALSHVLNDCDPVLAVTTTLVRKEIAAAAPRGIPVVVLDAEAEAPESWDSLLSDETAQPVETRSDDVAVLFYTSGTTGAPKGVPLTHENLCFQIRTLLEIKLAAPEDRCLIALPLHHVYPFVVGMLTSFGYGMCIVLPTVLQGPQILSAVQDCRATIIVGVPRLYEVLLTTLKERVRARGKVADALFRLGLGLSVFLRRRLGLRFGSWLFRSVHRRLGPDIRMVVSGGAALDPETAWAMEGLGWTVVTGYGLTETSPLISFVLPGDGRFETSGRQVPGIVIRIAPAEGETAPDVGEIQVRGAGVFGGYRNLPDHDARAFTDDGWFRTDDLGHFDRGGRLRVLGRASTMIVTGSGENVQPEEIEETYERHPLIREAGVLQAEEGLCAIIVPETSASEDETTLRAAIQQVAQRLPSYWRITNVVIGRDPLARTRLGKIRRAELRQRYQALAAETRGGFAQTSGVLPRERMTDSDKDLIDNPAAERVWNWLAGRYADRRVTLDSNPTLDLGIDSLEWMGLSLEVRRLTGVDITEEATSQIMTVRDLLVEVMKAADASEGGQGVTLDDPVALLNTRQLSWLAPLGPAGRTCAWLVHALNRAIARVFFRLDVRGKSNIPNTGNFVIAPNHTSVLDPFALAAALDYTVLRNTYWAAWTGMAFANPLFRTISRLAQALPIEDDRAAFSSLALGLAALGTGKNLIWFPEGGRSPDGRLQPFKLGTGMLIEKAGLPVVPVMIDGTFDAMPIGRRFPRLCQVRVTIGKPITPMELTRRGQGDRPGECMTTALHGVLAAMAEYEPDHPK